MTWPVLLAQRLWLVRRCVVTEAVTCVLLIRHGENEYVAQGKLAGRTPGVLLNERGRQQAAALAYRLADVKLDAVYSSPLERCMETAQAVADAKHLPVCSDAGLLEVDYGEWQGGILKELGASPIWKRMQANPSRFCFPQGETLRTMQNRLVDAIEEIRARNPNQTVAVFCHADPIKSVLAYYLGLPLDLFGRIGIDTASVSTLALREAGCMVVGMNDTGRIAEFAFPKPEANAEAAETQSS